MLKIIATLAVAVLIAIPTCLAYVPNLLHPYSSALIKLSDYDSTVRPPGIDNRDDPVNVSINMYVRSVERIDQMKNEFKIQLTFREAWTDTRLAFADYDREVSTNEVQLFWKPDVFFSNEKTGHLHTLTKPNTFVRINKGGELFISSRISMTLNCPMDLWHYPFDTQICQLRMASYGYLTEDVVLLWKGDDPVQMTDAEIPGYALLEVETLKCSSKTATGEYSCLLAAFTFKRNSYPYIIRIYLPLALLVFASWTSFWLPPTAALQRLTVGSITSITTALLLFREEEFLRLPSLTSMDVWVGVSAFFVFAAFFEYILVSHQFAQRKATISDDAENNGGKRKGIGKFFWVKIADDVETTDAISKMAFPVTYMTFHVIFGPFLF